MLYKYILVNPKPGMREEDFFNYWVVKHGPIGKAIPQVRDYIIYQRVPVAGDGSTAAFAGCAEVWMDHTADELGFIQSKEYVSGARLDEPNFLAFWNMVSIDVTPHTIVEPSLPQGNGVKLFLFHRRREGVPLHTYRRYARHGHAPLLAALPGLKGYHECHTVDRFYGPGEAFLDGVSVLWFDSTEAMEAAMASRAYAAATADRAGFLDTARQIMFAAKEVRISGKEEL